MPPSAPYSPLAVANYFIERAASEGEILDHLKLQKLVYIAHGWHLAISGKPLLNTPVQAWAYGPVLPELYQKLKVYGNAPVGSVIVDRSGFDIDVPEVPDEDSDTVDLLSRVWRAYKRFTGVQLSNFTHEPGTPWADIRETTGERRSATIPDDLIEKHFRFLAGEEVAHAQ
jgi:uncharacterized phage-associated protein